MALEAGAENRAALYVLAVPGAIAERRVAEDRGVGERDASSAAGTSPDDGSEVSARPRPTLTVTGTGTPTWFFTEELDPDARARAAEPEPGPLRGPDRTEGGERWPRTRAAGSRRERLELVRRLQLEAPDLRRLTDRALRHLLRPWLLAGWTVADLLYGLDHDHDGMERTWTTGVRSPGGWLLWRLQGWTITPGVACSPPSVELRAAESADLAAAAALSADLAAAAAERAASLEFGRRLEAATGPALYAELLEVVTARQFAGAQLRRAFAAAGAALVRAEVRAQLCPRCRVDERHSETESCVALDVDAAQLRAAAHVVLARR